MQPKIYLDNASTTMVHPEVLSTYQKILNDYFCNPDALYDDAQEVKRMIDNSRKAIADLLGVDSTEIIFTSGASEANNAAIKGVAFNNLNHKHLITSAIEHSSVLNACKQLESNFGFDLTILSVDKNGLIDLNELEKSIRKDTCLVTIMAVNNEVGTIEQIDKIKDIVKKHVNVHLHVDGVQALGKITLNLKDIDTISFSAHKIEGLNGSGILVKKRHVQLAPLISGGQQEFGLRGGTSNSATDIVFAKTLRLALENQNKYHDYIQSLHDFLLENLASVDSIHINSSEYSVNNIINFSSKVPSEVMMNALNRKGIMVSAQSTCASHSHAASHVLEAMGYDEMISTHCIRVSLSYHNTKEELEYFIDALKEIINNYD